jgi:hypothetical protein
MQKRSHSQRGMASEIEDMLKGHMANPGSLETCQLVAAWICPQP